MHAYKYYNSTVESVSSIVALLGGSFRSLAYRLASSFMLELIESHLASHHVIAFRRHC